MLAPDFAPLNPGYTVRDLSDRTEKLRLYLNFLDEFYGQAESQILE